MTHFITGITLRADNYTRAASKPFDPTRVTITYAEEGNKKGGLIFAMRNNCMDEEKFHIRCTMSRAEEVMEFITSTVQYLNSLKRSKHQTIDAEYRFNTDAFQVIILFATENGTGAPTVRVDIRSLQRDLSLGLVMIKDPVMDVSSRASTADASVAAKRDRDINHVIKIAAQLQQKYIDVMDTVKEMSGEED
jgi:hypothetical protein